MMTAREEFAMDGTFPSDKEFEEENVIPWRNVECGEGFEVVETRSVSTKKGASTILKLKKRDGATIDVWATKHLKSEFLS